MPNHGRSEKKTRGSPTSRSGRSVARSIHPDAWTAQTGGRQARVRRRSLDRRLELERIVDDEELVVPGDFDGSVLATCLAGACDLVCRCIGLAVDVDFEVHQGRLDLDV